jgi:acyl-CoA thioester hydrolase
MKKNILEIRVRYVETDQMRVAHHTSYFLWMEAARSELMRTNGMSYRTLEERGYFLPVREAHCRYRNSLKYEDIALIETELLEIGGASIKLGYRIFNKENKSSIADGYTIHPFTDINGRIVKTPGFFREIFED